MYNYYFNDPVERLEKARNDARENFQRVRPILKRFTSENDVMTLQAAFNQAVPDPDKLTTEEWWEVSRHTYNVERLLSFLYPDIDHIVKDAFCDKVLHITACDCDLDSDGDWGYYRSNGGSLLLHRFCPICGIRSRRPTKQNTLTALERSEAYLWKKVDDGRYEQTDIQPKKSVSSSRPVPQRSQSSGQEVEQLTEEQRQREVLNTLITGIHRASHLEYNVINNMLYKELCKQKGITTDDLYNNQTAIGTIIEKGWLLDLVGIAYMAYIKAERHKEKMTTQISYV